MEFDAMAIIVNEIDSSKAPNSLRLGR